ncbi:MAG: lactate racemase domain-containing protein [Pirellulaceae bacterium]
MSPQPSISVAELNQFAQANQIRSLQSNRANSIDSLASQVRSALSQPQDYPPFADSILPDDHVAIVVESPLPRVNEVVELVAVQIAEGRNVQVTIVVTPTAWEHFWKDRPTTFTVVSHDAADPQTLARLAIDRDDEPLYVNRVLFDADVVIPIGCLSVRERMQNQDCVVPAFLGRENQERFVSSTNSEKRRLIRMVSENLGTFAGCQVVLGPGGEVDLVLSGESESIRESAIDCLEKNWKYILQERYPVVLGTLESPAYAQTWDELAGALVTARTCAAAGGALVLVTQLSHRPPRDLRAALDGTLGAASSKASKLVQQVAEIAALHPIYLVSALKQADVENLGIGHVTNLMELTRLIERNGAALLVRDADQAVVEFSEQVPVL